MDLKLPRLDEYGRPIPEISRYGYADPNLEGIAAKQRAASEQSLWSYVGVPAAAMDLLGSATGFRSALPKRGARMEGAKTPTNDNSRFHPNYPDLHEFGLPIKNVEKALRSGGFNLTTPSIKQYLKYNPEVISPNVIETLKQKYPQNWERINSLRLKEASKHEMFVSELLGDAYIKQYGVDTAYRGEQLTKMGAHANYGGDTPPPATLTSVTQQLRDLAKEEAKPKLKIVPKEPPRSKFARERYPVTADDQQRVRTAEETISNNPLMQSIFKNPNYVSDEIARIKNTPQSKVGQVPPKTLEKGEVGESGYVYHATNSERLQEIFESGKLKTHKPHEFTDQDVWPDGKIEKRAYFGKSPENLYHFAPEYGSPVVIRTKTGSHIQEERGTGDLYSRKPIPINQLEYLGKDKKWHPIRDLEKKIVPQQEQYMKGSDFQLQAKHPYQFTGKKATDQAWAWADSQRGNPEAIKVANDRIQYYKHMADSYVPNPKSNQYKEELKVKNLFTYQQHLWEEALGRLNDPKFGVNVTEKPKLVVGYKNKRTGELVIGEKADIHPTLFSKHFGTNYDKALQFEEGFVTPSGEFLTRTDAIDWITKNQPDVRKNYRPSVSSSGKQYAEKKKYDEAVDYTEKYK